MSLSRLPFQCPPPNHAPLCPQHAARDTSRPQAGNKSLLSFRQDIGVPGYTGFIPSTHVIPLPVKGANLRTGKLADSQRKMDLTMSRPVQATEYLGSFQADPSIYAGRHKGGRWEYSPERSREVFSPPFLGTSTKIAEIDHPREFADAQLQPTLHTTALTADYAAARRAASSPGGGTAQSLSSTTRRVDSTGDLVGYKSTYQAMHVPDARTSPLWSTQPRPATTDDKLSERFQRLPRAMPPRCESDTTYSNNFGQDGSDPMSRTAPLASLMTKTSTTRELADGTIRNTCHLPGYSGFAPAAKTNALAVSHAFAADPRPDHKAAALLQSLDQYSRQRDPGYTGYKPQGTQYATVQWAVPTKDTQYGISNFETLKARASAHQVIAGMGKSRAVDGKKGIRGFFTAGNEFVSDNGMAEAEKFYVTLNPLEGRPRMQPVSKTTARGQHFNPLNSMV